MVDVQEMLQRGADSIDPDRYGREGYPHELFAQMRAAAPACRIEGPDYPFWALTRHADIVEVSRRPEIFSNSPRFQIVVGADFASDDAREPETMIHMDPPKHRQYRDLLAKRFTPRAMRGIERALAEIASEIVDELRAEGLEGECDFAERIAGPLPLAAIAWLLDLPRADWKRLYDWANAVVGATDPEYQQPGESAHETRLRASAEIYAYFESLAADRVGSRRDDLVSILARAKIDGQPLAPHELVSYCLILVVGGTETTRNALSGGMLGFFEAPEEWHSLVADPGLAPLATEEILRWSTPVVQMARTPLEDVEIAGQRIPKGEPIALFYASANRDERVFRDPFRFDIRRHPNPHLSLGVGEHYCMGANLARVELRVMLRQLAERFESIAPAGPPVRLRSSATGGVKSLPVRYRLRDRANV